MSVWLVLPVRSLRDGKTRLAPALDPAQRAALIEWLLVRTLEQAAQFPGLKRTLVVSPCEEARARASAFGARVLDEHPPGGLNQALRQSQLALSGLGATRMLMVACDLPLLRAEDLRRLASASSVDTVALAPDRGQQGTNGVCLETRAAFDFSFGPNSFERHLNCVGQLGMRSTIVDTPGLAFDVDTPEDLGELRGLEQRATEQETGSVFDRAGLHDPIRRTIA
jgi:2-phospho-L-lactate/phosphoenolpyruvate guanylyltransferase